MKLGQNVCLDRMSDKFENGSVWVKTRSQDQILEKPCVHCIGYILVQILMKLGQNVCFDDFYEEFENGSCRCEN